MNHAKALLFTAIFSTLLLSGCASTGSTPSGTGESATATVAPTPTTSSPAPAPAKTPAAKKPAANGAAEPECD